MTTIDIANTCCIPENIKTILEELSNSPAFAMSRGGRELFHTNFLAFILEQRTTTENCETYPQIIKKVLLERLFSANNTPKNVLVLREKLNFDLLIVPTDDIQGLSTESTISEENEELHYDKNLEIVVVEAKFKSIPTLEQLNQYTEKLKSSITLPLLDDEDSKKIVFNKQKNLIELTLTGVKKRLKFKLINFRCILLAPKIFALAALNQEGSNWINLSWGDFIKNTPTLKDDGDKRSQFIHEYLYSTELTIDLLQEVNDVVSSCIKSNESLSSFYKLSSHDLFRKMRIHDLVGKVVYEQIAKYFFEKISGNTEGLTYQAFLTNSTPGFQIEFVLTGNSLKEETGVGVQLQGVDYRHYIRRNFIDKENTLTSIAEANRNWIKDDVNTGFRGTETFKKFNTDGFIYMSRKVDNSSIEDLIQMLKNSLLRLGKYNAKTVIEFIKDQKI